MTIQLAFLTITISNRKLTEKEIRREQGFNHHIEKQQGYRDKFGQFSRMI